jgi:hypothetical protein
VKAWLVDAMEDLCAGRWQPGDWQVTAAGYLERAAHLESATRRGIRPGHPLWSYDLEVDADVLSGGYGADVVEAAIAAYHAHRIAFPPPKRRAPGKRARSAKWRDYLRLVTDGDA